MTTARSIRSSTIMFGLLPVGVRLYTSNESAEEIKFNLLHAKDNGRLKQQHACLACSEVVEDKDQVRGYEHAPGNYVVFSEAELDAFKAISTGLITIEEFIPASALDPIYVSEGHSFYVAPDKGCDREFAVLKEGLEETGTIGISRDSRDGKERLIAIRPYGNVMIVHELRYASEIRSADGVPVADATSTPPQLRAATALIDRMTNVTFVPDRYFDSVLVKRRELIEQKIANGESITVAPTAPPGKVDDLTEALRASLDSLKPRSSKRVIPKRSPRTRAQSVVTKARAVVAAKKKRKAS